MGSYAVISSAGIRDSDQLAIILAWPRSTWNGPLSVICDSRSVVAGLNINGPAHDSDACIAARAGVYFLAGVGV
jgi:hypothetical protein